MPLTLYLSLPLQDLSEALLEEEDCNVIAVDWGGGSLPLYSQAAANTRLVGLEVAHLITTLTVDISDHRRRINTGEKAKVVAAVWGTEFIQFLAALAILHQDDLKKRMNSSYSSNRPSAK